ncbi:MAG: pilus assembly protein PilM, partial [Halobacteriovoraceae bacterium]|nr:pilus assembly protein PilM [Halobacteriovoraceae bacterium]
AIIDSFIVEMERAIDFYTTSSPEDLFEECFVTGGTVLTPGLMTGIEELLKVPVTIFNPFDKIESARRIKQNELEEARHCGSVAFGLAMRSLVE